MSMISARLNDESSAHLDALKAAGMTTADAVRQGLAALTARRSEGDAEPAPCPHCEAHECPTYDTPDERITAGEGDGGMRDYLIGAAVVLVPFTLVLAVVFRMA
ncbi:hypothetical protein ACH46F_32630 [Streptomyces virginiae]|uniref:hypothetical protein n=1 Tax=Streptomyces virginiae TaxID=1961 RepID=UPI003796EB30